MRGYDDACGIARALGAVGERWALLVVRELMFGPKRYIDLRRGLPTMSENVLSQRLRELERSGVLLRRRLGPPSSVWVYELTARGRELEPVLIALARWGTRVPLDAAITADLSVDALVFALKTTFDAETAGALRTTCQLRLGDDRFHADVADGQFRVARGEIDDVDATLTASASTLQSLVFGDRPLADAEQAGDALIEGNRRATERLLRCFPRTVPCTPTSP
ncbi:winged helix-turn-helix transcriptional regulator [Plantactinospora sp. B6F1]|uniref:winged helix-turn-helix transcriptional regulator n=1 Tax=Plantactinospora sp. B6F1 TaxID=3158971 RepID=UPI0010DF4F60